MNFKKHEKAELDFIDKNRAALVRTHFLNGNKAEEFIKQLCQGFNGPCGFRFYSSFPGQVLCAKCQEKNIRASKPMNGKLRNPKRKGIRFQLIGRV